MARPPVPPQPRPTAPKKQLTVREMQRGLERLQGRIKDLEAFDTASMTATHPPEISGLQVSVKTAMEKIFGEDTADFRRFSDACNLQWEAGYAIGDYPALSDYQDGIRERISHSIAILREAINFLKEEIADQEQAGPAVVSTAAAAPVSHGRKVFVVHGHDEGAREAVARFLKDIGFEPIILHEQANQGRTVIEKVEDHGDVGFAVVLLTQDDIGCVKDGTPVPRARQNVVLELGYFVGRLGRKHVCALKRGDLEIPSDFGGVVYETFDTSGGWKQALGKELKAAGYEIDWNKVMQ
jgi:predicted nucleotide-binding protein